MRYFFAWVALLSATSAFSESQPLKETQDFMRSPQERQQLIQSDPKARQADDQVKALAGSPENTEAIYGLAADVMGNLSQQADGDPDKMDAILQKQNTREAVAYCLAHPQWKLSIQMHKVVGID